jgi:MtrB/PioB family decaheme-associated outer membrane protein
MLRFMGPIMRRACFSIGNMASRPVTDAGRRTALLISSLAFASPAAGIGDPPGNNLNPTGTDITRIRSEQGLSAFKEHPSRTPSGLLYNAPYAPLSYKKLNEDWQYRGSLDFGYLFGSDKRASSKFNDYSDWRTGPLLNYFSLSGWQEREGYFLDAQGGGVGRDDQYYQLSTGQLGTFRIDGLFNQTPHTYTDNAVTLFQGVGSEDLTLPSGLVPGRNSRNQIRQALASAYNPDLGIDREESRIGFSYTPTLGMKFFADFSHETREGRRAFGGSFLPPFYAGENAGGMVETIEPIDYTTNEIRSGFSYAGTDLELNLNYTGSFFANDKGRLTFDNPFTNLPGTDFIIERGRFDLYPDNSFHQVKADLAYRLPLRGQLTSTLSWSRMYQDDDLLPSTLNSGRTFTGIDMDQWNSVASLPRQSADAEITNWLFQLGLQLSPWDPLTLKAKFRYYNEANDTDYTAFNPLTGQYGLILEDGAQGGEVFRPTTPQPPFHYRSIPFSQAVMDWFFDADYRLSYKTTAGFSYHFEQHEPNYRERVSTDENHLKFHLSNRSLSWATLRLSYQYSTRDGSDYDYNPYLPFYTDSLPGFRSSLPDGVTPHTLADLRKYDLSDREQNQIKVQANFLPRDDLDLLASVNWTDNDYDVRYGLQNARTVSANLEANYQPSSRLNAYAFYSFQKQESQLSNINDVGVSADPNAGGRRFPYAAAWQESVDDINHLIGLGFSYQFEPFDIDIRYSYNWADTHVDYEAASNLAFANPATSNQPIDDRFPVINFDRHILETNLRWNLRKDISMRFYHRYEHSSTQDWHYDGLAPLIGNHLFLNAIPENYGEHVFGFFVQYRVQ